MEMGRNLLFINRYQEIVKEFADAMSGQNFEIETALNGLDAAAKLKKKEYQIVVTGLSLDGYNGEQIITYLNKSRPNTVCMIYTTTISPAQLHFFMNDRDVFKVFLRPVDFHVEFLQAIEEGFEYYDLRVKELEEETEQKEAYRQQKMECEMIEQRMRAKAHAQGTMNRYIKKLAELTIKEYGGKLDKEKKKQLEDRECKVVDLCCEQGEHAASGLSKAAEVVRSLRQ